MSIPTDHLARLSALAYEDVPRDRWTDGFELDGVHYEILEQTTGRSGYQGTIFQRVETGDIVVAHRGTEFNRQAMRDGLVTDGGMVLLGFNAQEADAMALTRLALETARDANVDACRMPSLTVTGHSLGGTLGQITAHRLGLPAETFNAYGAAGLTADYPTRDPDIVNHVRATDVVSAASKHVGEVRIYASEMDIAALQRHGYENGGRFPDARNMAGVAAGVGLRAHYLENFLSGEGHASIVAPENAARAAAHADMIGDYRRDIARGHGVLALPRNAVDGVLDLGGRLLGRARPDPAPPSAFQPGACAVPALAARESIDPLHEQALRGVQALDAGLGRAPGEASDRLAASLYRQAREGGLSRIDEVVLSRATRGAAAGAVAFAVEGRAGDPSARMVQVSTAEAMATTVDEALRAAEARRPVEPPVRAEESRRVAMAL